MSSFAEYDFKWSVHTTDAYTYTNAHTQVYILERAMLLAREISTTLRVLITIFTCK